MSERDVMRPDNQGAKGGLDIVELAEQLAEAESRAERLEHQLNELAAMPITTHGGLMTDLGNELRRARKDCDRVSGEIARLAIPCKRHLSVDFGDRTLRISLRPTGAVKLNRTELREYISRLEDLAALLDAFERAFPPETTKPGDGQ